MVLGKFLHNFIGNFRMSFNYLVPQQFKGKVTRTVLNQAI